MSIFGLQYFAGAVDLPYEDSFEFTDGYEAIGTLVPDADWFFDDTLLSVEVINTDASFGAQSLFVVGAGDLTLNISDSLTGSVRWVDFYVKPVFVDELNMTDTLISLGVAGTGFVKEGTVGYIFAADGDGLGSGEWFESSAPITLSGDTSQDWLRMTYRLDYASKVWDLYINGQLVSIDFGFVDNGLSQLGSLLLSAHDTSATGIDGLYLGNLSPIYEDADNDGIPDSYETAHLLNSTVDDRALDLDGDTIPNIEEYALGRLASVVDDDVDLYTSSDLGDDSYSGFSAMPGVPTVTDGPKKTVSEALDATTEDGAVILLQSGDYSESTLSLDGKNQTLRLNGPVTIQSLSLSL